MAMVMAGGRVRPSGAEAANCNRVELILVGAGDEIPEDLKDQFTAEEPGAVELPALEELNLDSPDHPTEPLFSGDCG
jgi:hypothetical protein